MSNASAPALWDRLLQAALAAWTDRVDLVTDATEELRLVVRQARRLQQLDADLERATTTRDRARRDLVALERRVELAVEEAVADAEKAAFRRTAKVAAARERAEQSLDEQHGPTLRAIRSRLATAQRELDRINTERVPLARNALLHEDGLADWLTALLATVEQTAARDSAAATTAREPWERRRARAEVVTARLRDHLPAAHLALDAAFGEGPIHLVGGRAAAVVEVRDGRQGIRAQAGPGGVTLLQVRPDGDTPIGIGDGSAKRLQEAVTRVAAATRMRPTPVVCLTGWEGPAQVVEGIWVCGPRSLADVLAALPMAPLDEAGLARAAAALADIPLPLPPVAAPSTLSHLLPVAIEDVPADLPALRRLVTTAHEQARSRMARTALAPAAA